MRNRWSFVSAFVACVLLCCSSGCAGMGSLRHEPDGSGGFNVYRVENGARLEVAHIKDGKVEYKDARLAEGARGIEREAGGLTSGESLSQVVKSQARGSHAGEGCEWAWVFFFIYIFVYIILCIIEACESTEDCE